MKVPDILALAQTVVIFVTLIVLIWQTRVNIKTTRMAQYQDALKMVFDVRSELLDGGDPHMDKDEYEDVKEAYSKLGKKEYYGKLKIFHTFEIFFLLYKFNVIDENMWKGWHNNIKLTFLSEGNRTAWNIQKKIGIFHPEFTQLVEGIIKNSYKEQTS